MDLPTLKFPTPPPHLLYLHVGAPRYKRGRYSDPGPRGRDHEQTTEEKLESLIMRVGEKVGLRFFVMHQNPSSEFCGFICDCFAVELQVTREEPRVTGRHFAERYVQL